MGRLSPRMISVRVRLMKRGVEQASSVVAVLEDNLRRQMYLYIRRQARPVGRDEAAAAAGISRKLAAFHLDKLVDKGLLKAHYARLPGRSGPGAGRPSKHYELSDAEVEVSIPERRYDLMGDIVVAALAGEAPDAAVRERARTRAWDQGRQMGEQARQERGLRRASSAERVVAAAQEVLDSCGFEPYRDERGGIALRNCPFHDLARQAPEVVCSLNQAFIDGLLRGLGNDRVEAGLEPRTNECCVNLRAPGRDEGAIGDKGRKGA